MKKTILIAISLLAATYLGTMMWIDASATLQEDGWEIVPEGSYANWSDTPPELNPDVVTTLYYQCPDLPPGNWYLFDCHIDGPKATCECRPNNEMNASWDNAAWFQY